MRFHSRSYQTLPSTPHGRVLSEPILAHICDNAPGDASAYIRNCDAPDVAYHLIYEGEGVSLDTTPLLVPVNSVRLEGSLSLPAIAWSIYFPIRTPPRPQNVSYLRADKLFCSRNVESSNRLILWVPLSRPFPVFPWSPWMPMTTLMTFPPSMNRIPRPLRRPHLPKASHMSAQ